jgi:hypothetical protein
MQHTYATQYQTAVANRDKMIAANEAATNKAREQNDAAMAKYNAVPGCAGMQRSRRGRKRLAVRRQAFKLSVRRL